MFGFYTAFGAALDNAAFAGSVAGRYRASERWLLGVDAEYNPWFSLDAKRFRPGTINIYSTFIKRYPIDERLSLRITGHLGVSVLLFDLIGAPAGSTGLYLGGNLLGIDYRLGDYIYLVLDPADFSVPIPHVTGAPLIYRQYRITVGMQFGA